MIEDWIKRRMNESKKGIMEGEMNVRIKEGWVDKDIGRMERMKDRRKDE